MNGDEAEWAAPWNLMLYLANYYAAKNPNDASLIANFTRWRADSYSMEQLARHGREKLQGLKVARDEAASAKAEKAEPRKARCQKAADAIWRKRPTLSKAAVAIIVAKDLNLENAKPTTIAKWIKKPA